jgi:hypothetical protein
MKIKELYYKRNDVHERRMDTYIHVHRDLKIQTSLLS